MKNNVFNNQEGFCKIFSVSIIAICILIAAISTLTLISKAVKADPPTNPILTGNITGHKNIEYTYMALSTDPDGDNISYTFDWGDESSTTMGYYQSGTPVSNATHIWVYAGVFNIWVQSKDQNNVTSQKTYLTILIDTIKVDDIGYLIDHDGDSVYNIFQSIAGEDFHLVTNTTKLDDGTYLIDSDETLGWNWIYDLQADTLTALPSEETQVGNSIWYALLAGMIIALIFILIIFVITKKKKEK